MNSPKSAICGTYRYSVARGVFLRRQPGLTRDGKITWISTLFKLVIRTSGDFFYGKSRMCLPFKSRFSI